MVFIVLCCYIAYVETKEHVGVRRIYDLKLMVASDHSDTIISPDSKSGIRILDPWASVCL